MKKKKGSRWIAVPVTIAIVLVLIIGAGAMMIARYYSLSNYVSDESETTKATDLATGSEVDSMVDGTGLTDSEAAALESQVSSDTADITLPSTDTENTDVYNLLLVGVDRRDKTWYGNSDVMVVMSINKKTKQIHLVSFMRDLYANIEGHGVRKLNAACAYGGCPLLVSTIESNYKVHIDNYAYVDFDAMISIIDKIGGVTLDITEAEVPYVNGSVNEMCRLAGEDPADHQLTKSGTVDCDGYQAVAYARIRKVGNSDYQRTERQRTVLIKMLEKVKSMNIVQMNSFFTSVLPYVTHNISSSTITKMIPEIPSILKYEVVQGRIPYDNMYLVKEEILIPDMSATIEKLHQELYG